LAKKALMGALTLYLDFINLLVSLLRSPGRIGGNRGDPPWSIRESAQER